MNLFSKLGDLLGLVETVDDDDDYGYDDMGFEENKSSNSSSFGSSFGGFNETPATPAPKINPFDNAINKPVRGGKIATYTASDQIKMIVINPEDYDTAREICDYIKSGKPVVVNLENMAFETAQRVMDFLSGSCYSLNGNVQRVAKNIFIVAPNNIDVSADIRSQQAKANLPWMNQSTGMNKNNNPML